MPSKLLCRVAGNFLFSFATTFSAVHLITEHGVFDLTAIGAGLITGTVAGLLAAAKELNDFGNVVTATTKKSKTTKVLENIVPI